MNKMIIIFLIIVCVTVLCLYFLYLPSDKQILENTETTQKENATKFENYHLSYYPLVTAVCITRKRVVYLEKAIQDFFNQTYPNKELLIVFDSDDTETENLIETIKDSRVKTYKNYSKKTLGALRNLSIDNSNGEYIIQWDDDDRYHPKRIEYQLKESLMNGGKACFLDRWNIVDMVTGDNYLSHKRIWEGSILAPKELLLKYRYSDKKMGEDTDMVNNMKKFDNIVLLTYYDLYIYYLHGENTWGDEHRKQLIKHSIKINKITTTNIFRLTTTGGSKVLQFIEYFPTQNSFTCDMKKIWGPDVDAEFIAEILHDYKLLSSSIHTVQQSDVLAVSTNKYSVNDIKNAIIKAKPRVLLLLSDERGNRSEYETLFNLVPLVYRQYRYNSYENPPNQLILPLGYHCWDQSIKKDNVPIKYIWSFIGSSKNKRLDDLKQLNVIKPNFHGSTKPEQNAGIINGSIFVFCPIGNVNVECFRNYTASMCGAIPFLLCSDDQWNEIYPYFDIEPPWLHTDSVEKMIVMMHNLMNNPRQLIKLRNSVLQWWTNIKNTIYLNIDSCVLKL